LKDDNPLAHLASEKDILKKSEVEFFSALATFLRITLGNPLYVF